MDIHLYKYVLVLYLIKNVEVFHHRVIELLDIKKT